MSELLEAALPYLASRGITPETAERYLLYRKGDALMIPYLDARGELRGVAKRNLDHTPGQAYPPKYEWPRGLPRHLYNVVDADSKLVYLSEGELDCLILKQHGLAAVGVPGVNNFRREWVWLFAGRAVRVIFDADKPRPNPHKPGHFIAPGPDSAQAKVQLLRRVTDDVTWIRLPEGEDVTSLEVDGKLETYL